MTIPEPTVKLPHFTKVELRFNDFDMLGHLNNAVFFELTDLAKARFMESLMNEVDWRHLNLAVVNIECNYYAQIFPNDKVGVYTGVQRISQHSFRLEQRVVDLESDKVFAVTFTVFVAFDPVTLQSALLPDTLRQHLEDSMGTR